jgi:DNA-binding response OmpR family regulator
MQKRRILIAEDEKNIVISLEFLLRQAGYEVAVAGDGQAALHEIAACQPDLILLDIMLPQKNGFDICREIRATKASDDIKIVMLSAKGRESEVAKGLSLGADAYVTKPFSTHELLDTVRRLLE